MSDPLSEIRAALALRFSDPPEPPDAPAGVEALARMAARSSCRDYTSRPVEEGLIRFLASIALASPTKSDLQQRDIVHVTDSQVRRKLNALVGDQDWVGAAPAFVVFCGNNYRQRLLHDWRGRPFVNDHLDAFFNAAVDAAIALGAFVTAAEAIGLGCCPVSAIRNHSSEVSELLALPPYVFPVAGLATGWPAGPPTIQQRLPLSVTVHRDRFDATSLREAIESYDRRRADEQPYASQRFVDEYGHSEPYGWSEDKARQYSKPERTHFGEFVRDQGFRLE